MASIPLSLLTRPVGFGCGVAEAAALFLHAFQSSLSLLELCLMALIKALTSLTMVSSVQFRWMVQ